MKKILFSFALAAGLLACGPSINPKTQAFVDDWRTKLAAVDASFPERAMPVGAWKLVPGTWAQYLSNQKDHGPAQITYKVLAAEEGGVWLEIERYDYQGHTIMKVLLTEAPSMEPASWSPKRIITQNEGQPAQELPPFLLDTLAKPALGMAKVDWQTSGASEAVTVIAGRFDGAKKILSRADTAFGTFESESFGHGAVPITGMLKSRATDDSFSMELVAFGESGAMTSIVGEVQGFGS